MTYEEFLNHFTVIKRGSVKSQCLCPCHDDKTASLTISKGNKCILLHCHAGCSFDDILDAAGLKKFDLFYDKPVSENVPQWLKFVQKCAERDGKKLVDYYHYSLLTGEYAFTRLRYKPKSFSYGILKDGRFTFRLNGQHREDIPAVYGSIESVKKAIKNGEPIFYCEGEKDVSTLKKHGFPAVTCGAVGDWRGDCKELFVNGNVIMLAHNDSGGMELANKVKTDLLNVSKSVRVVVPCPDLPHGDISDFFAAGHTREDFQKLIAEDPVKSETVQERSGDLVERLKELNAVDRFATNDKGAAELFAAVFGDTCRYNPTQRDFMHFDGVKWTADTEGMKAKKNAKLLADALLKYAVNLDNVGDERRKEYIKFASKLMNYRDRNIMVNDSRDLNFFDNEMLDANDYLLNCQNVVLDLSGDEPKVLQHDADLLLSKVCNAVYNPTATCPLWEKTVAEIMLDDQEKIRYLQKIFGLCLTGNTSEEEFYIFFGGSTRNGKSTVCETILYILQDYAQTLQPESLGIKPNKDSRTATPDIAKLAGCRLVIASEPPKKMLFDTSLVKTLTGRDRITARFLNQNQFNFTPRFKLILNTNYLPTINDSTVFKSERIRVLSFDRHFDSSEQNKKLKDELKAESDGILNWMIQGWMLYRQEGLNPPAAVLNATREYEESSDKIGRFVSECLEPSEKNTPAKLVYETFQKWCDASGCGTESKSNFFSELKAKGLFAAQGTVNGKTVRNVVFRREIIDDDFEPVGENEPLPFD